MTETRPVRVAIVGGGCAAMACAFELTQPALAGRYEVTVYQMGWRLGGKGASGRGPAGRIEEHGLHLWMGYYENAFQMMRACYRELARDPATCPIASFDQAFEHAGRNVAADRTPSGTWTFWEASLPETPGACGDGQTFSPTLRDYIARLALLARTVLVSISARAGEPALENPAATLDTVELWLGRLLRYGRLGGLSVAAEALSFVERVLQGVIDARQSAVLELLQQISKTVRARVQALVQHDDELRRLWEIADLTLATLRGAISHRLAFDPRGFDALDDYDARRWLLLHGASDASVNSAFIRALYDLAFAYEDGRPERPSISAAAALRGTLRAFFTYRGAFFWRMNAGMGDVVFAPMYELLRRRGVRFQFFHRLDHVGIAESSPSARPHVDHLRLSVQARTHDGSEYAPLVQVRGLPCWPAQPKFEQLRAGASLQAAGLDFESPWQAFPESVTLRAGEHFDSVVLAVGLGAIPAICSELIARDARWRTMVERVPTVATQAFQLWLSEDMASLGLPGEPANISGFVEPFDTLADMTHVAGLEDWPTTPRTIAYFCSALCAQPNDDASARSCARAVLENAERFVARDLKTLWPHAYDGSGHFRYDLLAAADSSTHTPHDLGSQYWTANVKPSDRYAQAAPGSARYRISPLDPSYANLTIAGDWTACGLNMGCVEAAVMSGRLAAHAIAGAPVLEDIHGFDHP